MTANSNPPLVVPLLAFTVIFTYLAGTCTASTTLLITGRASNNLYKEALARQLVPSYDEYSIHAASADFLVFGPSLLAHQTPAAAIDHLVASFQGVALGSNLTRLVISRLGSDQMSLDHIAMLYAFIKTEQPLVLVEIGENTVQTRALLNKGALCWGETSARIQSPNTAFLCNSLQPSRIGSIIDMEQLETIGEPLREAWLEPQPRPFWPCIFASAAKADKHKKKQVEIDVEDEDVNEIVEELMKEDATDGPHKTSKPVDQKLQCKYRRSCYESGELPEIDKEFHFWFSTQVAEAAAPEKGDIDGDGIPDEEDDDIDITALKLKCKYRFDCYKEHNVPQTSKDAEKEEQRSILASKSVPSGGKKRTLKDIAERTVQKVKAAEVKAANRPLSTAMIAEKRMNAIEEKLNEKLSCKYRKSCYESGKLPEIAESAWSFNVFSAAASKEIVAEDAVDFNELEELDQKFYCKYRKSCYSTGIKPDIEPDIQINSFEDLRSLPDIVETRKMTLQEKCKYRKSCYESGVLPDLSPSLEKVIHKEVSSIIPTSMGDLKMLCKYRKSCYEEIAESATVDTVKNIRKRRIIEKEVHKRKARRAKLRRRLRGEVELGVYRKPTRKEKASAKSPEVAGTHDDVKNLKKKVVPEVEETIVDVDEPVAEKLDAKKIQRKKKAEPVKEEQLPEPEPETSKPKKSYKKVKEPESEQEPEPENEEPRKKKFKKAKEPEPELEEVEKQPKVKKSKPAVVPVVVPVDVVEEADEAPSVKQESAAEEEQTPKLSKSTKKTGKKKDGVKVPVPVPEATRGHDDDDDEEYKERQQKRDFCKYRKSCYDNGEKPVIDQTVESLYSSFNIHVDKHYEKSSTQHPKSEADQKLDCKYRKSCYETGELPDLSVTIDQNADKPSFKEISSGSSKKLICKYRKSCYEANGINEEKDDVTVTEEARKPTIKTVVREPKQKVAVDKKAHHEAEDTDSDDDDDSKDDKQEQKIVHTAEQLAVGHGLEVDQKLDCKYRRSCYGTAKPRAKKEDHSGSMARQQGIPIRTKCNQYYLSCREQLGLKPKEKAPMGPNGRRLCRKKKE